MPSWDKVLREIARERASGNAAVDRIRRKYLQQLAQHTGRNVIAYYSGWLSRGPNTPHLSIGDEDKNAFMTAVHKLDRSKGLDLLLHTPGGNVAATESLVDYLWTMFDKDIRVVVPQIAMSAGTMIAFASRQIVMGRQSNLGPMDPQLGGVPAQAVLQEFELATNSIKADPASIPLWQAIIGKYHPTFLTECIHAIKWSKGMAQQWLETCMFEGQHDAADKAAQIINYFSSHDKTYTHSRHISMLECESHGLNVMQLESDPKLQDLVLTAHHAFMHTFSQTQAIKIVENSLGIATVIAQQMMQVPAGFMPLGAQLPDGPSKAPQPSPPVQAPTEQPPSSPADSP